MKSFTAPGPLSPSRTANEICVRPSALAARSSRRAACRKTPLQSLALLSLSFALIVTPTCSQLASATEPSPTAIRKAITKQFELSVRKLAKIDAALRNLERKSSTREARRKLLIERSRYRTLKARPIPDLSERYVELKPGNFGALGNRTFTKERDSSWSDFGATLTEQEVLSTLGVDVKRIGAIVILEEKQLIGRTVRQSFRFQGFKQTDLKVDRSRAAREFRLMRVVLEGTNNPSCDVTVKPTVYVDKDAFGNLIINRLDMTPYLKEFRESCDQLISPSDM